MTEPAHLKLIVGLGNPGAEYAATRHNIGFMVLTKLLAGFPAGRFIESSQASSRVFAGRFRGRDLVLQMPQTYMNLSGEAVRPLAGRLKLAPEEILVISDDLDLPFGRLRLREGGSDGGHNGLKSIIAELGSDRFKRLRVGIGRPVPHHGADYALSRFEGGEAEALETVISTAAAAVKAVLSGGMIRAMNGYNSRDILNTESKATENQTK